MRQSNSTTAIYPDWNIARSGLIFSLVLSLDIFRSFDSSSQNLRGTCCRDSSSTHKQTYNRKRCIWKFRSISQSHYYLLLDQVVWTVAPLKWLRLSCWMFSKICPWELKLTSFHLFQQFFLSTSREVCILDSEPDTGEAETRLFKEVSSGYK